ncbi:MAG: hypothetical protein JWR46_516, partial [Mycobacterium sp.]|nr:hypothetical protein [Mycobacterium sp.]
HVANGDIGTQVATKQPGTDPRVDYIFLCRWFDVSASGQSLTVTAPILHPLANNTFKQLFTTWVVGRIRDVTSGTVAAALDPPIDAGGQENRPIEVWPKFAIPSELTDYAAPNFVIPLNPFADEPGDYQVRVDLDGVRIASLPLRLEGFG